MWFYAGGSFAITLFNILLWALTFTKRRLSPLAQSYFWWSFFISLWSFGYGLTLSGLFDYQITLWINKWCQAMAMLIGPFFFRFGCCVADEFEKYRMTYKFYLWFGIINAVGLFFTPYYVKGLWSFGEFRYQPLGGPLYIVFTSFFFWCTIHSFIVAARKYRGTIGQKKKQIKLFLLGTGIAYSGGGELFLQGFGIPVPSYGVFPILAYVIIIGYAIHKYQFLDFPNLLRKTVVFTGLFGMVMLIVGAVSALTQIFISQYVAINQVIATTVSIFLALFLYDPARKFLMNVTDRYLFQKKEDVRIILNRLSKEIITILDIDKVGKAILSTLERSLRLEAGAILLKDERGDLYKILDSFGLRDKNLEFQKNDLLIQFFAETNKIVNLENTEEREALPESLRQGLQNLRAVIAIPLFIHIDLIGLLLLGKKKSDQEFTKEEIDSFPTVAGQAAIALSNARLYDKLKKSQIDFAQQAKMAAIGTLSAGISHEIKNPLNHIKVGIAMLRMNKKHGVLDKLERPQFEEEIFKTLEILDENVTRANAVIERLSSFAKKPKELKMEPVDLRKAMNMALSFVEQEFSQYNIEVQKNFPDSFPSVMADLQTLEDVFLNLLVNARHAMEQKGCITIEVIVQDGELSVSIQDSGKGIPKENLEKIFDPFFTTKDVSRNPDKDAVKGSGLGLFIVREFIQRFGGRITVESQQGKGTTFRIFFPNTTWVKGS